MNISSTSLKSLILSRWVHLCNPCLLIIIFPKHLLKITLTLTYMLNIKHIKCMSYTFKQQWAQVLILKQTCSFRSAHRIKEVLMKKKKKEVSSNSKMVFYYFKHLLVYINCTKEWDLLWQLNYLSNVLWSHVSPHSPSSLTDGVSCIPG